MSFEKDKLYDRLQSLTQKVSVVAAFFVICITLLICMAFDYSKKDYWSGMEQIFSYEIGSLIAIIVLIWTFTVSFSIYFIEHCGECYYGIRRAELLLAELKGHGVVCLAAIFSVELFALIIVSVLQWKITLLMIAFQQFVITIYMFLLITVKTSYRNTLVQIEKDIEIVFNLNLEGLVQQIKEVSGNVNFKQSKNFPLLFKMIRGIDYSDVDDKAELLYMIKKVIVLMHQKLAGCRKDDVRLHRMQINTILVSYQIGADILKSVKSQEVLEDFFDRIMSDAEIFEFKQGLMAALLEVMTLQNIHICQKMVRIENIHDRELQIWCMVYNIFMQQYGGEQWRKIYIRHQLRELYFSWDQNEVELMVGYWKQILDVWNQALTGKLGEYKPLFSYIF
ncbi:MAG: hypothetical protein HFH29_11695 [Eubacterium sp.]|nr:hypothetical protein [Eubacterium sp.]